MTSRVALVTGGTGGIGTEICKTLANNDYRVVASWLSGVDDGEAWQAKLKEEGYDFAIAEGDVSDFESAAAMVKKAETKVGPIDILVNCAGITKDSFMHKMKHDQWDAVLRVNLDSVFNVTRQVIMGMRNRGFGRIINISSVNGQKGQIGQANYSAAKAGMHGFTMALAQESAKKGITVNTISPGYIATSMVAEMGEKIVNKMIEQIPVGRLGQPEEIARVVEFLAADESGFITGANIAINGGMHMG
ncbi:MAG: acetoacetyl-CoA reductase [Candidatus Parabeggiatoa sp. nov. 3]|mgnify:CR=1 FL=1|nr:MAG: acetoacetyl-CoA reductase [Gammaproteobacteria bacterium]RKZ66717.1 MAG: acetoacetyl-CoA reductase [Gammaproteobacteria bacterium]RKZ86033.1 MAG: acetoacetyl-CoA reductase [Gammaproteobacteria bacterium]